MNSVKTGKPRRGAILVEKCEIFFYSPVGAAFFNKEVIKLIK